MRKTFQFGWGTLIPVVSLLMAVATQSLHAERTGKAVFIQRPANAPDKVFLVAPEKEAIEVPLPGRNFSPAIKLPKGDLTFAILPRPLGEDELIPKGAPTLRIPEGWNLCYFVFVVDKGNKVFPVKALPINASNNEFRLGDSRIINLTAALVKGQFGKEIVTVNPGKIGTIKPPVKEGGDFPVRIDYMMKNDKKSTPLVQTRWLHYPESRQVIFITKAADARYPRVSALQDRVEKPVEN